MSVCGEREAARGTRDRHRERHRERDYAAVARTVSETV